jgi:hypothetical protein
MRGASIHATYHSWEGEIVEKVVFVPCQFRRGAFPHERIFIIRLEGGWEYRGLAPVTYCLKPDLSPLGELPLADAEVEGRIVGIQIGLPRNGSARVQLPDGEVYELPEDRLVSALGAESHVPVES